MAVGGVGVPGAPDLRATDPRAATFALLLAGALLLHVLWWHGPVLWTPWAAVAACAAWLVACPSSVGRLALLLAAAAVAILAELPSLGTHLLLLLAVAAWVLADLVVGLIRTGRSQGAGDAVGGRRSGVDGARSPPSRAARLRSPRLPDAGAVWSRLAPFLRAAVVVLYVAAVLAKLNATYLDAATSPAGPLAGKVLWFAPVAFDGDWRAAGAIWGSLLVEATLPVLLLAPRTRRVGLVVGLTFHGVLAASGTVPFTALMLAFYVAFLPAGAARRTARAGAWRWPARGRGRVAAVVGLVGLWVAGALVGLDPGRVDGSVLATATRVAVLVGVAAAIRVVLARPRPGRPDVLAGRRPVGAPPRVGRPRGLGVAVAVLVACAASPYLGWRAGDAFTMYSGLRAGPSSWNHVLLPSAVRLRE